MKKTTLALFISGVLASFPAYSEENEPLETETLETIVVSGDAFSQQMGTQKITAEQIDMMPTRNGNITDFLKNNPNVRFSQSANLGNTGGEIRPDEVSFHGEKYYNNNFILDGMSNNDNLNPGASQNVRYNDAATPYGLPEGGTQSMWIDSSLLKNVEVFDSNVSAKYGNFTGGVINAELKDPDLTRWNTGKVYYRTTRNQWASLYAPERKDDDFASSYGLDQQSHYTKHIYGFNVSQKFSENTAMLFGYSRTVSDIEFNHNRLRMIDDKGREIPQIIKEPQRRESETFLWRGIYLPENGDLWRLTAIYAPHESRLTRPNIYQGAYTTKGGGLQINLEWEKQFEGLKMKTYVGYKRTGDKIENLESDMHNYLSGSALFPWGTGTTTSPRGGYGKFETQKTIYTLKQDFSLTEFDLWDTAHKLNFGWQFDYAQAKYRRSIASGLYNYSSTNTRYVQNANLPSGAQFQSGRVYCGGLSNCYDNDQYAYLVRLYEPRDVSVNDSDWAAYIEDNMKWKDLELNLGARFNYNRYLKNYNIAHRISASYDVFGNGDTRLFAGSNRYYASSMLAHKLKEGIGVNDRYARYVDPQTGELQDWTKLSSSDGDYPTMSNKAKTPYSDEIVLGLSQKFLAHNFTFKWVNRKSRDGFTSDSRYVNGRVYKTLANTGRTDNDTLTFTLSPVKPYDFEYMTLHWSINASRSITKSNNKTYNESADATAERIIYNNRLLPADDLPPSDFNSPWGIGASIVTTFPKINLTWAQDITYRRGREYLERDDTPIQCSSATYRNICGDYYGSAYSVSDAKMGSEFNLDWRFTYKQYVTENQFAEITVDINNVLNKKVMSSSGGSGGSTGTYYKMGRNFWLGVSYNW